MAETQAQVISDLHLKYPAAYDLLQIDSKAPYLALISDIGSSKVKAFSTSPPPTTFLSHHLPISR